MVQNLSLWLFILCFYLVNTGFKAETQDEIDKRQVTVQKWRGWFLCLVRSDNLNHSSFSFCFFFLFLYSFTLCTWEMQLRSIMLKPRKTIIIFYPKWSESKSHSFFSHRFSIELSVTFLYICWVVAVRAKQEKLEYIVMGRTLMDLLQDFFLMKQRCYHVRNTNV